jgi:hypothetical protein
LRILSAERSSASDLLDLPYISTHTDRVLEVTIHTRSVSLALFLSRASALPLTQSYIQIETLLEVTVYELFRHFWFALALGLTAVVLQAQVACLNLLLMRAG